MAHLRCDFRSEILDMGTSMTVFLPESIDCRKVPAVYLLHGLADNCTGWARYTSVERYARKYDVAVVIPEIQRSCYTDMANGLDYFSFVDKELPTFCRNMFGLNAESSSRYIMGLSMGGYGSLKSVLHNPGLYSGCAVFSAVIDMASRVRESDGNMRREFSAIFSNLDDIGVENDLFAMLEKADAKDIPRIYMACGERDSLFSHSTRFRDALVKKGVDCKFESWEGIHDWDFWDVAVKKAFDHFFS